MIRSALKAGALGVVLVVLVGVTGLASAATCGGVIPCQCGDTVVGDYLLAGDLGPCPGDGLLPQSNVLLDCQGFTVRGSGDGAATYGIYLRGVAAVTVQNCVVTGFERGIRLRDTSDSLVRDSTSHANGDFVAGVGYGIDLASGALGNVIQGNLVIENADEGIHLGTGSAGNELTENTLWGNAREQIYMLGVTGTHLLRNSTGAPGSNSLYLKDSTDNYLEGNRFADRVAVVTGNAANNVFVANDFVGAGLQLRVYEASPDRIPTDNVVVGGSITNANTCLRFRRAARNTAADVELAGCVTEVLAEGAATEVSENTLVGMVLDPARVSVDAYSILGVGWWFTETVRDGGGAPLADASILATDAEGVVAFDLVTDGAGGIPPQILLEYERTGAGTTAKTPHTVTTAKSGYVGETQGVSMTGDVALDVVLEEITTSTTSTSSTTTSTRPLGRRQPKH